MISPTGGLTVSGDDKIPGKMNPAADPPPLVYVRAFTVSDVKLNLPKMLAAKNASVTGLTSGIESYLFKKNKIDYVKGTAKFASPTQLSVKLTEGGETMVEAKNIIIATGSEVTPFPGIEIDEKQIVSSTGALDLQEVPKKVSLDERACVGAKRLMVRLARVR